MAKKKNHGSIQSDCSKFETNNWVLILDKRLSPEENSRVGETIDSHPDTSWDKDGDEFSLPGTIWCIKQVRDDVEAKDWHHEPINVFVRGLYLSSKVYEIEGAMSYKEAAETARKTWKEQYGHHGIQATIAEVRLATEKDMRKMHRLKEQ